MSVGIVPNTSDCVLFFFFFQAEDGIRDPDRDWSSDVCSSDLPPLRLPGELQADEAVAVFPKVTAYVDSISVDRGTRVRSGQVMARLVAPELAAQREIGRASCRERV